ncbi:MAG: HAMP domain-containing protein [Rhodomicrobium sp.]|nr:HAMP domain-containing protein [Rhodomicrobium sp.]
MLKNLKISTRLFIALLLPAIVVLGLSAQTILSKWKLRSETALLQKVAEEVNVISRAIHELQRERGLSQGFLASKGAQMKDKLAEQRETTQQRLKPLEQSLIDLEQIEVSDEFIQQVKASEAALAAIASKRSAIDALSVSPVESFAYYTDLINEKLLGLVSQITKLSTRGDVSRLIASYESFMRAKEMSGQERAIGAGGLAQGRFEAKNYVKFVSLIAAQDAFFKAFKSTASMRQIDLLERLASSPVRANLDEKRGIILAKGLEGGMEGLDAAGWWKSTTERIDLLKSIEDRIAADLSENTGAIVARADLDLAVLGIIVLAVLSIVVAGGLIMARSITKPISGLTRVMSELADGHFDVEVDGTDRKDEVGAMARAVNVFRTNSIERVQLEAAAKQTRQKEIMRQQSMDQHLLAFKDAISSNIDILLSEVGGLRSASQSLLSAAGQANTEASSSASSCSEAAASAQAVAAATEELNASIREIAGQAHHTSSIVGETTQKAQATDQEVAKLTEAVNKIDSVITLIRTIAQQTNLLALNATIESARAGEAGRGFAVVAAEVKALSEQTAKATEEIAQQIQTVQATTETAATAIRAIGAQVGEIHGLATSVAAAVEEQEAATSDIARNVHVAATGSQAAAASSQIVTQVAEQTGTEAQRVASASDQLQAVSAAVSKAVQDFIEAVSSDLHERRTASRYDVDKAIIVTKGGDRHDVRAINVSRTGMKISSVKGLNLGDTVMVDFGFDRAPAKVTWVTPDACGLEFAKSLSKDVPTDPRWQDMQAGKRAA